MLSVLISPGPWERGYVIQGIECGQKKLQREWNANWTEPAGRTWPWAGSVVLGWAVSAVLLGLFALEQVEALLR